MICIAIGDKILSLIYNRQIMQNTNSFYIILYGNKIKLPFTNNTSIVHEFSLGLHNSITMKGMESLLTLYFTLHEDYYLRLIRQKINAMLYLYVESYFVLIWY